MLKLLDYWIRSRMPLGWHLNTLRTKQKYNHESKTAIVDPCHKVYSKLLEDGNVALWAKYGLKACIVYCIFLTQIYINIYATKLVSYIFLNILA